MNRRIVVLAYGNPGRQDDGLGPAFAAKLEERGLPGVTVESDYQLTIEDAAIVAEHEVVIFADASMQGREPFDFHRIEARGDTSFTSHHVTPESVLALTHDLFSRSVEAYVLSIRGYAFGEFEEALSEHAQANLRAAFEFICERLQQLMTGQSNAGCEI